MPFITVSQGGGSEIPDGVYPVTLVEIKGPKTVTAQRGPKAGQDIDLLDWIFAVDEGDFDGTPIEASTSTASGPKSKMYAWLTALFNGVAPQVGATFETTDLYGRRALATIKNSDGWPRIENLGAMPASMQQRAFAAQTGVAVQAAPAPSVAPAPTPLPIQQIVPPQPAATDDLPF